jgi:hypothetical protein
LLERGDAQEAEALLAATRLVDELPVSVHLFFFQYARGRVRIETGAVARGVEDVLVLGERTLLPFDNPARGSSRHGRSSSSAPRSAAQTSAPRRATSVARASSSSTARGLRGSWSAATKSSQQPAHARASSSSAESTADRERAPPGGSWPRRIGATRRSHRGCSSP